MSQRRQRCWRCGDERVIWLPLAGVPIAIEPCEPASGDLAIQQEISGAEILVHMPSTRTRFRRHRCPPAAAGSFTGSAPARKVRE